MLERGVQQRKSRKLDELSEDSFDFFHFTPSLSFSSRSEGSLYNTKQKKVQLYAQATLNVQHQAIHPYTPFLQRTSRRANLKTNKQKSVANVLVSSSCQALRDYSSQHRAAILSLFNPTLFVVFPSKNPSLRPQDFFLFHPWRP